MGHGGETSEGSEQVGSKTPKSIKERGKGMQGKQCTDSKKQAKGKGRGRRAVYISSSSKPTDLEDSASNRRKRAIPLREGDTAEPKPK